MSSFVTDRTLLNPKFEGYRLHALTQESHILRTRLPSDHKPTQAAVSGRTFLSFQEVQSRINHNHLAVRDDRAVYVDAESNVVLVELDPSTLKPNLRTIYSLPQTIQTTSSSDQPPREYPSVAFSSNTTCFVSDGHGYLYILHLPSDGGSSEAELLGSYELSVPEQYNSSIQTSPFKIHSASEVMPNTIICILSSRFRPTVDESMSTSTTSARTKTQVEFDVWAVRFTFPLTPSDDVRPLDIIWHRRGEDVPILASYDASRQAFFLLGSCTYHALSTDAPSEPANRPSELTTTHPPPTSTDVAMPDSTQKPTPPPYSWTQTEDTVSLAFPLPTSMPTSSIKVAFSPRSLSVLAPSLRYPAKTLWGPINPTQSLWTFDREADTRGGWGLLTVHLDKRDVGTRWPQVFEKEDGVQESLDPSEVAGILEAMEKFTSVVEENQKSQAEGGLGTGVPSLARDEYDEEVDESVGREGRVTWVDARVTADGEAEGAYEEPEWWAVRGKDRDEIVGLLSTPLPGTEGPASLVIKEHLDGVLFTLASSTAEWKWTHTATFPALSFVLASKRDTRFTYHTTADTQKRLVMAFESGSQTFGGNVYLYREPRGKEKWGEQSVLKVGGGEAGGVLGVGAVRVGERNVVMCLCEGELAVLKDVL
ncbi:hypothetical protein OE88DRAFT_1412631 [Heliocybe sulcata]|uniref:NudC domain-containing protein 1 n=1 Tax=Heliocybe sulcata TaxID=5364 RepID=A0A5C3N5I3_9AGAM|nr:hypothetical protein OE88DRAFT_1412631 [Heliocybe sulcata]